MSLSMRLALVLLASTLAVPHVAAQESKAAQATRVKLKQVIGEFDLKEIGTKDFFATVNLELDKSINFKIDNTTGISNNTKLTYKAKKVTVEKLLNDVSDKYDFGWVVISNAGNNKVDGWVIIRKNEKFKERGYEAGKEPKKSGALPSLPRSIALQDGIILDTPRFLRVFVDVQAIAKR